MIITKAKGAFLLTCMMLIFIPAGLMAQVPTPQQQEQQPAPDYSEEELETFVAATGDIIAIQESFQERMISAIEEEGLSAQEFQMISQQQQQQQEGEEMEMSEEKKQSYANAMTKVVSIQEEMNEKMQSTVEEHDMEVQEYQEMSMHVQQSPELSQKVDEMMQE